MAETATASVLDVIAAKSAACCQYHPNFPKSKMYKSTGTIMNVLASTTSKAKEMMCNNTCKSQGICFGLETSSKSQAC